MPLATVYRNIRVASRVLSIASLLSLVLAAGPHTLAGLRLATERLDPTVVIRHQLAAVTYSDFDAEIRAALAGQDAELARSLADLALSYGHVIDPVLLAEIAEAEKFSLTRSVGEVFDGVVLGKTDTMVNFLSAVVADQLVIGDIRDLGIEAGKYPNYDRTTVALAGAGLVASAATLVSGPGARIGVSVLKAVKKVGALSPRLLRQIGEIGGDLVDLGAAREVLQNASHTSLRKTGDDLVKLFRKDKLDTLMRAATSAGGLFKGQGFRGAADTLKKVDRLEDLPHYQRLSDSLGSKYRGALKLMGVGKLTLGIADIIGSTLLAILQSVWFAIAVGLTSLQFSLKPVLRRLFRRQTAATPALAVAPMPSGGPQT